MARNSHAHDRVLGLFSSGGGRQTEVTTQIEDTVERQGEWSVDDANSLYMIDRWGGGYFDVNRDGKLTVAPLQEAGVNIPIVDVLKEAQVLNLGTPLLI